MNNKKDLYNEYLTTDMTEEDLIFKLDKIQEKTVKSDGVIYTPWNIVNRMIEMAAPQPNMNIIEPSCGHGIFLIGLIKHMRGKIPDKNLLQWFTTRVQGIDISENTISETKEIISLFFKKELNIDVEPESLKNIKAHDSLTYVSPRPINLCIGNPPYIRAKHLDKEYLNYLKTNFISCKKGTTDIYFAFIEKYSKISDNLVFITPNSFLTSKAGEPLKDSLIDKLDTLIDFKEKRVFSDANVYTTIFKTTLGKKSDTMLYGNDLEQLLEVKIQDTLYNKTSENGIFDTVLSGLATLCDGVYIVKRNEQGQFIAEDTFGELHEIEEGIVAPYLKLTKIKDRQDIDKIDFMIYPYNKDKTVIDEATLQEKYPKAYKYLLKSKDRLMQRDKGKTDRYESWYAYGRKQGLHEINNEYIISIPQMIGGKCKPIKIDIGDLIKDFGKIVFTSGYIIPQNDENKEACKHLLGEEFLAYSKKNGRAWPGSGDVQSYYSLTAKQIKKFNV